MTDSGKEAGTGATAQAAPADSRRTSGTSWMEVVKVVALPLVTLVLGFVFNGSISRRQSSDNNMRLFTEIITSREKADSDLRKDMFNSILGSFMAKKEGLDEEHLLEQQVLNLELLAYNFNESLDVGPVFKDVRRRIPNDSQGPNAELRRRLEKVGQEVIERQLTTLSGSGEFERGDAELSEDKLKNFEVYFIYGAQAILPPGKKSGEANSRICLSIESDNDERRYRQFMLDMLAYDLESREIRVRLQVSRPVSAQECKQPDLNLGDKDEIDTNFSVGWFDFPLIDNTRLSDGERASVSLTWLSSSSARVAIAYFPGSRASMKDRPYYDEVLRELAPSVRSAEAESK